MWTNMISPGKMQVTRFDAPIYPIDLLFFSFTSYFNDVSWHDDGKRPTLMTDKIWITLFQISWNKKRYGMKILANNFVISAYFWFEKEKHFLWFHFTEIVAIICSIQCFHKKSYVLLHLHSAWFWPLVMIKIYNWMIYCQLTSNNWSNLFWFSFVNSLMLHKVNN